MLPREGLAMRLISKSVSFLWASGYDPSWAQGLQFLILMWVLGSKEVRKLERGAGHCVWAQFWSTELSCFPLSPGLWNLRAMERRPVQNQCCVRVLIGFTRASLNSALIMSHVFVKPFHKHLLAYSSKRKNAGVLRMRCSIICLWKSKLSNGKPLTGFNVGEWRLRAWGAHRICNLKITLITVERRLKGLNIWQHQIGNYSALVYRIINSNFD